MPTDSNIDTKEKTTHQSCWLNYLTTPMVQYSDGESTSLVPKCFCPDSVTPDLKTARDRSGFDKKFWALDMCNESTQIICLGILFLIKRHWISRVNSYDTRDLREWYQKAIKAINILPSNQRLYHSLCWSEFQLEKEDRCLSD